MKKHLIIYHSTKKVECITILWWVLVLLFVHLTSRLTSTFSCTLYHAFTLVSLPPIIGQVHNRTLKKIACDDEYVYHAHRFFHFLNNLQGLIQLQKVLKLQKYTSTSWPWTWNCKNGHKPTHHNTILSIWCPYRM
jgi:hypothetical protein